MNRASSATGWVRNPDGTLGYTCSSKTGCLNGCPYCYARRLAHGRLLSTYGFNTNLAPGALGSFKSGEGWVGDLTGDYADPFYPRFWPERLEQIRKRKKPAGIFLDDMSDWMGSYWPEEWTNAELQVIRDCPQHRFYTLTKQAENLIKFSPFPDNCWVGATATNANAFYEALLGLNRISARVKFISAEPLLSRFWQPQLEGMGDVLAWLIIGAQTRPSVYPRIEWVREIVEAADKAGIPVFLKDNLKPILPPFGNELFPPAIRVRQEMPQ